jgi:hypothetical protein
VCVPCWQRSAVLLTDAAASPRVADTVYLLQYKEAYVDRGVSYLVKVCSKECECFDMLDNIFTNSPC